MNRIQSAARVSIPVAPRILFPLYGRGELPADVRCLVEKHLIFLVYAQKAQRCIFLLDTTEAVEDEEDRRHSTVRLVADIIETRCSVEDTPSAAQLVVVRGGKRHHYPQEASFGCRRKHRQQQTNPTGHSSTWVKVDLWSVK